MKKLRAINAGSPPQGTRLFWLFQNISKDEADIDIFDVIGGDGFWEDGITAAAFVKELRALGDVSRINLHINSPGGYVSDGLAIYNAIRQHPAETLALVESEASSIASVVAMAADKVLIAKNARMQIHDAMGFAFGNAAVMEGVVAELNEQSDNIASIYAEKTGEPKAQWREAMQANGGDGTSYRGQGAVDAGLADDLLVAPARRDIAALRNQALRSNDAPPPADPRPESADNEELPFNLGAILRENAQLESPEPSLEALLGKYPLREAVAGAAKGGS